MNRRLDRAFVIVVWILVVLLLLLVLLTHRPVNAMCFTFEFGDDQLDPGDIMSFQGPIGIDGLGFQNVYDEPQSERTLCVNRESNQSVLATFARTNEPITWRAESGTVDIKSVTVDISRIGLHE